MGSGRRLAAAMCAAAVLVTGCGKIADKTIEKATGCKDVNAGNGSVSCNGVGVNLKGDGTVPAGFPAELDPPKGAKIYESTATPGANGKTFTLVASLPGDPKNIHTQLKHQLTSAGYTIGDDSVVDGSAGVGGTLSAQNKKWSVEAIFGQNTTGTTDGGTYITMEVSPLSADQIQAQSTTTEAGSGDGVSSDDTTTVPATTPTTGATDASVPATGGVSVGGSLPDGFPKDLAPPAGAKIVTAIASGGSDEVVAGLDGSTNDIFAALKKQITDAGYTISVASTSNVGGSTYGTISATKGATSVSATVTPDVSGVSGKPVLVTMTIQTS